MDEWIKRAAAPLPPPAQMFETANSLRRPVDTELRLDEVVPVWNWRRFVSPQAIQDNPLARWLSGLAFGRPKYLGLPQPLPNPSAGNL